MDQHIESDESAKLYQYKYLPPQAEVKPETKDKTQAIKKAQEENKQPPQEKKTLTNEELEAAIQKKRDLSQMDKTYNPAAVEDNWYDYWKKLGVFHCDEKLAKNASADEKYVIVVPPPNITGYLHIGHALTAAIEDSLVRWSRMKGLLTEYLPGTDHAGIATQSIVEKQLWKTQKKTKYDIGRDKFMEEIWSWKNQHCDHILKQFERIGSSLDWPRLAFTMDDNLSYAVQESFVRLYDRGLIYRANRLVNWSCQLRTAISDIEVEFQDVDTPTKFSVPGHEGTYEFGTLTEFAYKFKDGSGEIIVATTRLETMLGDVAVAVNSKDPRYTNIIGKELQHPFIKDRKMTIITDDTLVDMSFGTGAVKITPAHDQNDFDCGMRNKLEFINIFTEDGRINENGGMFKGMMRFDARFKLEEELKKLGLLKGKKPNKMRLGFCQRSKDVIEPILKPQWWMDCKDIAKKLIEVVKTKELVILPEEYEKNWNYWLENIKEWCISRQLWWGHRIPAFLVWKKGQDKPSGQSNEDWVVARNMEEAIEKAEKKYNMTKDQFQLLQDEDVLDTWYSSALFPFSPFFWPNTDHDDFKAFYPNTILETGHDILFFWVARMVMFGILLTDKVPFKYVYLHPIIRDAYGKKMSKSKGNVIDPIEIIEGTTLDSLLQKLYNGNLDEKELASAIKLKKQEFPEGIPECGCDALRFGLLAYLQQTRSLNLDVKRIIGWRTFCNKIWQSYKFATSKFPKDFKYDRKIIQDYDSLMFLNKWILSALNQAVIRINNGLEKYEFAEATTGFHSFWLYEFCDLYIEGTKDTFKSGTQKEIHETLTVLFTVLEVGMRLLHPLMPYISEELYQKLPEFEGKSKTLVIAPYPKENPAWAKPNILSQFSDIFSTVKVLRQLYSSINLPNNVKPKAFFIQLDESKPEFKKLIIDNKTLICSLSGTSEFQIGFANEITVPKGCITGVVGTLLQVQAEVKQYLNIQAEIERLKKNVEKNQALLDSYKKKMNIPNYKEKVPETVQQTNQVSLEKCLMEKEKLEESLQLYKSFLEN